MDSVLMFWGLWGWFDGYSWEDGKNGVGLLEGRRCLLFLYILLYHVLRLDVSMDMRFDSENDCVFFGRVNLCTHLRWRYT